MNLLIISLLLQQKPTANEVVQRMTAYIRQANSMTAEFKLTSAQAKDAGVAVINYVRPDRLCFTVKWTGLDYRFVGNDHGCWDANYVSKTYDETTDWYFNFIGSAISSAPVLFNPGFMMDGTLASAPVGKPKYKGNSQIDGVDADEIEAVGQTEDLKLYIAADGKPVRYDAIHGRIEVVADLTKISMNTPVDKSLFGYNPPLGYAEYTVPLPAKPVTIHQRFPIAGWSEKGGAALGTANKTFLMVTTVGCEPSARAAASLRNLAASRAVTVLTLSLAPNGALPQGLSGFPVLYDPSGKLIRQINMPGTPMFYLLGKDGTIIKDWYGFDSDKAQAFEKDVLDTVKNGYTGS